METSKLILIMLLIVPLLFPIAIAEPGNKDPSIKNGNSDLLEEDSGFNDNVIDLWNYASDKEDPVENLTFSIIPPQSNPEIVNCELDFDDEFVASIRYLDCTTKPNMSGNSDVTVQVTDTGGLTATGIFTINVEPVNDPPIVSDIGEISFDEDTFFVINLNDYVEDIDTPDSEIDWSSGSGVIEVSIDKDNLATLTPPENWFGTEEIIFEAYDGGETGESIATVIVINVNDAPIIEIEDFDLFEDDGFNNDFVNLWAYTEDEDTYESLTFSIISETNPEIVDCELDSDRYLDCTTQMDMFGNSEITIQVKDTGNLISIDIFKIKVKPVNDPPILEEMQTISLLEDSGFNDNIIDLWSYASDVEDLDKKLMFSIISETNTEVVDCELDFDDEFVDSIRYLDCTTQTDMFGNSEITIQVTDTGGLTATGIATINIEADVDGDGIPDTIDTLIYSDDAIDTNTGPLSIAVNGSEDISQTFTGIQLVEFKEGEQILLSFDFNFDEGTLDLLQLLLIEQEEAAIQGSIIISGLTLQETITKTVYMKDINETSNQVCIKDAEITSISEITEQCNAEDETVVVCLDEGNTKNGYTCTDLGDYYKIDGLKHSGVKEIEPFCGDGTCNSEENCDSCATDCGACSVPSSGTGSSDSKKIKIVETEPVICEEISKTCTDWSTCTSTGRQSRSCQIIKDCGLKTETNVEWEEQTCTYEEPKEQAAELGQVVEETQLQEEKKVLRVTPEGFTILGTEFEMTRAKALLPPLIILLMILLIIGKKSRIHIKTYRKIKQKIRKNNFKLF